MEEWRSTKVLIFWLTSVILAVVTHPTSTNLIAVRERVDSRLIVAPGSMVITVARLARVGIIGGTVSPRLVVVERKTSLTVKSLRVVHTVTYRVNIGTTATGMTVASTPADEVSENNMLTYAHYPNKITTKYARWTCWNRITPGDGEICIHKCPTLSVGKLGEDLDDSPIVKILVSMRSLHATSYGDNIDQPSKLSCDTVDNKSMRS